MMPIPLLLPMVRFPTAIPKTRLRGRPGSTFSYYPYSISARRSDVSPLTRQILAFGRAATRRFANLRGHALPRLPFRGRGPGYHFRRVEYRFVTSLLPNRDVMLYLAIRCDGCAISRMAAGIGDVLTLKTAHEDRIRPHYHPWGVNERRPALIRRTRPGKGVEEALRVYYCISPQIRGIALEYRPMGYFSRPLYHGGLDVDFASPRSNAMHLRLRFSWPRLSFLVVDVFISHRFPTMPRRAISASPALPYGGRTETQRNPTEFCRKSYTNSPAAAQCIGALWDYVDGRPADAI